MLESEERHPNYLWVLLSGTVALHKRADIMYTQSGESIDISKVPLWRNPADCGDQKLGARITLINASNLLADDSLVFKQPLLYSIKCESSVLGWRIPTKLCYSMLTEETFNKLRIFCLEKYRYLFTRLERIDKVLNNIEVIGPVLLAAETEKRARMNY